MNNPNYGNAQHIQTPQYSAPQKKIGFNTQYITTVPGIIHLLIIVSLCFFFY
jgi:hypothetical protein